MFNLFRKKKKEKVGFTCGTFDLCHAGHVLMFKECKDMCDYLIVGLQTDPTIDRPSKNKPVQSLKERRLQLEAIKYIDEIVEYKSEMDLFLFLRARKPDVRILGIDWKDKPFTGKNIPGIKNVFNSRNHNYSSSELRRRITEQELAKQFLQSVK